MGNTQQDLVRDDFERSFVNRIQHRFRGLAPAQIHRHFVGGCPVDRPDAKRSQAAPCRPSTM